MSIALVQYSDDDLLTFYRESKDAKWIGELYKRYAHLVMGLCFKYLKEEEAARDAVVDIFEMIMQKLLENEVIFFRSWLYMVSKNHLLRKLQRKRSNPEVSLPSDDILGEKFMENGTEMSLNGELELLDVREQHLHQALNSLKEEQRQCIRLFYFDKKSYVEIAEVTGFDIKQVKSFIQNGKRNMKLTLEENRVFA